MKLKDILPPTKKAKSKAKAKPASKGSAAKVKQKEHPKDPPTIP